MRHKGVMLLTVSLLALSSFAGDVACSPGLKTDELKALLDRVESAQTGKPYIVAKTEMLKAFFAN